MKRFVFVQFIILFTTSLQAYYFRSYQVEDGLSHNSVWTVMQDSRGFMWFGTNDGLNRFDGKSFKVFKKQPGNPYSIGNNFIHCLKEDSQGRFFVGTKEGLYLYDSDLERFEQVSLNRAAGDEASIHAVFESQSGEIWVACHGQGLYVLNPDLSIKKHFVKDGTPDSLPCNSIWTVVQDYVGNIWLGTSGGGLVLFDSQREKFTQMSADPDFEIKDPVVNTLFCDADYNLWVGTFMSGLYRYNYRTGKVCNYMNQEAFNIKSIVEYSDHELIMGCDRGLVTFDRNKESFTLLNSSMDNMTDNSIFSITRDNEGSFWIGTYFGGVNYFSPMINTFSYYYNSPKESSKKSIVSSFAEDEDGKIWVGTYNDGLSLFNAETERFDPVRIDVGYHNVQDLYFDNGKLYVSLYGQGIAILNVETGEIEHLSQRPEVGEKISSFVTTIFKSAKGYYLFASDDGVTMYYPRTREARKIVELDALPVKDIVEDYNGALWFATHAHGLLRLNADGTWDTFAHDTGDTLSLPTNNVNCVYQDSKFRIWAGTEGCGLLLFNAQKQRFEQTLNVRNGLPSNIVYAVQDDAEGNMWVATGGGLIRLGDSLKSVEGFGFLEDVQRIRYNPKAVLKTVDNRIYFGGTNGFIAFYPKEIKRNEEKPALEFTGFQVFNKAIVPGADSYLKMGLNKTERIVLDRKQSTFSFDFVALSYLAPDENSYAYMLEGFDADWNYVHGDNRAHYMNIPRGEYVFKVKGSNNNGVWSDVKRIEIKVKPPFFASLGMIFFYSFLLVNIVMLALWRYNKRIDSENKEKIYKYKVEKEKEIYQTQIKFFTGIAHEIRTPLTLITAPLENILNSGDGNEKTKSNLNVIKVNADRLLNLINQLLDFRKVEENMFLLKFHYQDIVAIVRSVYTQYYQNAKMNGIEMALTVQEEPINLSVDSEAIYKIVSNLVSNAVKYAKSRIDITVEVANGSVLVSVDDDGVGIDKIYSDKVFEPFFQVEDGDNTLKSGSGLGLSLAKALAEKHSGELMVNCEEGRGSLFILRIPIMKREEHVEELLEEQHLDVPEIHAGKADSARQYILIVEDSRDLREFLVNSLQDDYVVFEAEDGVRALEILETEMIDIIVSDIMMPRMDGLELCNRVKSNVAYSHIPIILLSAKTDVLTKIEGLNKGADVYLEKPFSFEQLKAQINSVIENRNHIRENFMQSPLRYFKQNTNVEKKSDDAEFIEKLNTYVLDNLSDEDFTLESLSELFSMSRSLFHRKIKSLTGLTPNDYVKVIRLTQSAQLLASGKYKVNEVCYMVGFNTPSYFSKCFYKQFGKLPKDYIVVSEENV